MSFPVIKAMIPKRESATMRDSIKMVDACTIVLNMFGVFILYIKMRHSMPNTIVNTMIRTIL